MSGPYQTYGRPGKTHTKAYTGTHGVTDDPIGSNISLVRVMMTTAGFFKIGPPSVTATSTDGVPMGANIPEYFAINPGEHVSGIQLSAGGNLHVTEMH